MAARLQFACADARTCCEDKARYACRECRHEDGTGKGDGLVTYLKQPSVDLAIQILDSTPLRDGDGQRMSVSQVGGACPKPPVCGACVMIQ